jgi:hypothetical protein
MRRFLAGTSSVQGLTEEANHSTLAFSRISLRDPCHGIFCRRQNRWLRSPSPLFPFVTRTKHIGDYRGCHHDPDSTESHADDKTI